ncbi:MAG: FAD-dependent oxidoreductase [Actinobacteria bacterium]|nr:FAD-dependent oxidoreductase [Actinomycetota bacterium]
MPTLTEPDVAASASAPRAVDVAVVGAGIVGLSCAHFLAQAGIDVVVIERGEVGSGSSFGNTGLVAPSHSVPLAAPGVVRKGLGWMLRPDSPFYIRPRLDRDLAAWLLRFARSARRGPMLAAIPALRDLCNRSHDLYLRIVEEAGDPELTIARSGVLNVYGSEGSFRAGRAEAELLAGYGLRSEAVSGEELSTIEPFVRAGAAGGIIWGDDGFIDPALFVGGWRRRLEDAGVRFATSLELMELREEDRGDVRMTTTAGELKARVVVAAAGAWTSRLLRSAGTRLRVQPAKGYSLTAKLGTARGPRRGLLLADAKVAVAPMRSGLRIAGTMEMSGLDPGIDLRRVEAVRRSALAYLDIEPDELERARTWRGFRAVSADGLPVIGRLPRTPSVLVATGHGHIGVTLGPATGEMIAQIVQGVPATVDPWPFRPER